MGQHGRDLNTSMPCIIPKRKTQDKEKINAYDIDKNVGTKRGMSQGKRSRDIKQNSTMGSCYAHAIAHIT